MGNHGIYFLLMSCFADIMIEAVLSMVSDEQEKMVIMGDFNICPRKHPGKFQLLAQG